MTETETGCLLCGAPLEYLERASRLRCVLCGKEREGNVECAEGHYVCDRCHALGARRIIEEVCRETPRIDPIGLAVSLMRLPSVHMHGPEHHFLVPAVLLATYLNAAGRSAQKEAPVKEARSRSEAVPGGVCGNWGACGAAIGVGTFVSLATGATPLSTDAWRLANGATARVLARIAASGGPRCCKRDTFHALLEAIDIVRDALGVELPIEGPVVCDFHSGNRECLGAQCPFSPLARPAV